MGDSEIKPNDLEQIADLHAALRRLATDLSQGARPAELFNAVAEEAARLLGMPLAAVDRYEPDGSSVVLGAWGDGPWQSGVRSTNDGPGLRKWVRDTGRPARVDHFAPDPSQDRPAHPGGRRSVGVGVPIIVDGGVWGGLFAGAFQPLRLTDDSESRLSAFAQLVTASILNAQAGLELDESQGFYRDTITQAGAVPYVFSYAENRYTFIGDGIEALTGYTREEFTADRFNEMIEETVLLGERAASGGEADPVNGVHAMRWRADQRIRTRNDEVRWISDTSVEIAGRDGRSVVGMLQDITERKRTEEHARLLAEEQAALRRVATLVAREANPDDVFTAVAQEAATLLTAPLVLMARFERDATATVVAVSADEPFEVATNLPLDGSSILASIYESGGTARLDDYTSLSGTIAGRVQAAGLKSAVGVPIPVGGTTWGAMLAAARGAEPLPEDTESRLARFTELVAAAISNAQARQDLRGLADEQAALRRVATLVADGAEPRVVFDSVCLETGRLLGASSTNLAQFTDDGFNVMVAGWSLRDTHVPTDTRLPLEGDTIDLLVRRTATPQRVDSYEGVAGELAELIRRRGIHSEIGAPVVVEGRVWGTLIAGSDTDEPLPEGTEARLANFAELIATAVSNASAQSELVASRARIVTAADEARLKIERDLHDGTQQQLVALDLELALLEGAIESSPAEATSQLERIRQLVGTVLDDVQEISRGVHPATLSQRGLGPALRALGRRSVVPVELEVVVPGRLPPSIEIAAYYSVSEALANVAKHAQASHVTVTVVTDSSGLRATVADDGVGGADPHTGTGLAGLVDRVEALGGQLEVSSPQGEGTRITVELPLEAAAAARG